MAVKKNISLIFLFYCFLWYHAVISNLKLLMTKFLWWRMCFSLDETTYYESKAIFQFENEGESICFFRMKEKKEASYLDI